jgi:DNA-binding MarR family transcriptional regulator
VSRAPRARRPARRADLETSLWVRLLGCHNLVLAELRRAMPPEVTIARFDLLANLHHEDGLSLAELSRRMLVTAGNLTGLVERAVRDGVVLRQRDASDGRVMRVHLTDAGRALYAEVLPLHAARVAALLDGLDASERRELRQLLGKLRDSLQPREMHP